MLKVARQRPRNLERQGPGQLSFSLPCSCLLQFFHIFSLIFVFDCGVLKFVLQPCTSTGDINRRDKEITRVGCSRDLPRSAWHGQCFQRVVRPGSAQLRGSTRCFFKWTHTVHIHIASIHILHHLSYCLGSIYTFAYLRISA